MQETDEKVIKLLTIYKPDRKKMFGKANVNLSASPKFISDIISTTLNEIIKAIV